MIADIEQVHHVARLAFLAMAARAVAASEFEGFPEVSKVVFTVHRPDAFPQVELPIDVEFQTLGGLPVGGMSL